KLDGEVLSEKQWGVPYPVDTGAHVLVASANGYVTATVHVRIPGDGTSTTASIPSLKKAAVELPAPTASASSSAERPDPDAGPAKEGGISPQTRTAVAIGGGALALGGIVAGGVALGVSFAKADERQKAQLDPFGRDAGKAAARAEADAQSAAIWCFAGGGVAAAGTAIFYLVTRSRIRAPVKAGGFVGPGGPSIWVQGQF